MSIEAVLGWILAALGSLLALLIKHIYDCRNNITRLAKIEQHLRDKTGFSA